MAPYDFVIVGAGISGMTSAILLAQKGLSVAIVESFPKAAPTVRGFKRQGVYFDTGLHYVGGLGDGHVLNTYLSHLGIASDITPVPYNHDGFDVIRFEESGQEFTLPRGYDACREYLIKAFPAEKDAITAYFAHVQKTFNASPFLNFTLPFSFDSALHEDATTLRTYLDEITANHTLKVLLSYQCLLYGVPPYNALFSTHALVAGSYYQSAHTIEGGGLALTKAYETKLRTLNIDIFYKSRVANILISKEKSLQGVLLDNGETIPASSCIWTGQPADMVNALPESIFRPSYRTRLKELKSTMSGFMLFGVSEAPVPELDGCCRYVWPGGTFREKLEGDPLPDGNIIYLNSSKDHVSGKTAVTAIFPCSFSAYAQWEQSKYGARPKEYKLFKQDVTKNLVASLKQRCPELAGVDFIESATPLTLRDYCSTQNGSLYGLKHANDQFNPAPITKQKGLYLAGQGIVAPGILGAIVSAYLTCGLVIGHEQLHQELREWTEKE